MSSPAERLRQAAAAGNVAQVRELCKAGAKIDPDLEGRTAVHLASANGHVATVKALIDAGAKVNVKDAAGYSPLHQAATEGHEEVVLLLLQNGCHVDTQDELHGNTALHEAAWKGYSRTVEVLCKHRANVYIKNHGGFTPLHLTCQNGHNQSCRILLLSACKPDIRNSYGDTALHTASRYGHAGVLRILISAFCCVSETNKNGDTALHISTAMGRRKLTKILLEAGCDQKLKNNQGETARDIAERKEYNEVVNLLDNPPVTLIPVLENEKCPLKPPKSVGKKREKDSGTSQESSSKEKKEKHKKSKKGHKVHFSPVDTKKGNVSPYGCHMYPNMEYFPSVKLKSLPPEPLKRGEQYYADLAGNIKKGPTGLGYMCYCAPFFNHVEKKLDANKKELLTHIDHKNEDLKAKITHLEQRTHDQLFSLNQKMKESLALERTECSERMDRRILRERHELQSQQESSVQSLRTDMKSWMHSEKTLTNGHNSAAMTRCQMHNNLPLARSKSADLLSESDSHQWSTDLQSDSRGLTSRPQSKNCNDFEAYQDFRHRIYVNAKNCGTRPKYDTRILPKISKLKSKCDNHPVLTRDSRSEGDLTSCHTAVTDNIPYTSTSPLKLKETSNLNILDRNPMKYSSSTNFQSNHVHYQPSKNNYTMNTDTPGVLWNRNRFVTDNAIRKGPLLGKQENECVQTKGFQGAQNCLTKINQEKNQNKEPLIIPEQNHQASFSTVSVAQPRVSVNHTGKRQENLNNNVLPVEQSVINLQSYQISAETTGRPNEAIALPIQTDGSSFV